MSTKGYDISSMLSEDKKKIFDKQPVISKKIGRPTKSEETKKSERMVCYLTVSELEELKELSEAADINNSHYIRKIILQHIKSMKEEIE